MAFCSKCGKELADGVKFCVSCGTPVGGVAPVAPTVSQTSTSTKAGNIRKCPACGASVPSMVAVCPDCGHEFSNVKATQSVQAFFEKFDALEQQIFESISENEKVELTKVKGKHDPYSSVRLQMAGDKRRLALIQGFPVPNTKEDILEFLLTASPRYADKEANEEIRSAWRGKCQQVYSKAKIILAGDKTALYQVNAIMREAGLISDGTVIGNVKSSWAKQSSGTRSSIQVVVIFVVILAVIGIVSALSSTKASAKDKDGIPAETARLEALLAEINESIEAGDYRTATLKAADLQWTYRNSWSGSPDALVKSWEAKQKTVLKEIETAQKDENGEVSDENASDENASGRKSKLQRLQDRALQKLDGVLEKLEE